MLYYSFFIFLTMRLLTVVRITLCCKKDFCSDSGFQTKIAVCYLCMLHQQTLKFIIPKPILSIKIKLNKSYFKSN